MTLNGEVIIDVDQGLVSSLRQKPKKGYVCLQNHGGNVVFRAMSIRQITRDAP